MCWLNEWQTWIGLMMLPCAPVMRWFNLWLQKSSARRIHARTTKPMQEIENDEQHQRFFRAQGSSLVTGWDTCAAYLLIFSAIKYSPRLAVICAFVCTSLLSGARVAYHFLAPRMRLPGFVGRFNEMVDKQNKMENKGLSPVSVYTDLEMSNFFQYGSVFAIQGFLYWVLAQFVLDQELRVHESHEERWKYAWGAVIGTVIRITLESFYTKEFLPFWKPLLTCDDFQKCREIRHTYPLVIMRCVLSWWINDVCAQAILWLLPIILINSSDRLEFVKDATAVLFIELLDDLDGTSSERQILPDGYRHTE